jgi:hypothetical protein
MPVTEPVMTIELPGFMCGTRRLGHVKVPVEIGLHCAIEMLLRKVFKARDVFLEGGVVDQDVELAELLESLLDRGFTEAQIRNVSGHRDTTSLFGLDRTTGTQKPSNR